MLKSDKCKHYTGAINPHTKGLCAAGVNYRALVGGADLGWVTRLPCVHAEAVGGEKISCDKFELPTAEEVAEDKRRHDEHLKRLMTALSGNVREWRKAQGWSKKNRVAATGMVPCEACGKGEIHLSMAAYNGHVWGKCTTEGCVSWVE